MQKSCRQLSKQGRNHPRQPFARTPFHCARQPCYCLFVTGDWFAAWHRVSLAYRRAGFGLSGRHHVTGHAHRALISERACERIGCAQRAGRRSVCGYRFVNLQHERSEPQILMRRTASRASLRGPTSVEPVATRQRAVSAPSMSASLPASPAGRARPQRACFVGRPLPVGRTSTR